MPGIRGFIIPFRMPIRFCVSIWHFFNAISILLTTYIKRDLWCLVPYPLIDFTAQICIIMTIIIRHNLQYIDHIFADRISLVLIIDDIFQCSGYRKIRAERFQTVWFPGFVIFLPKGTVLVLLLDILGDRFKPLCLRIIECCLKILIDQTACGRLLRRIGSGSRCKQIFIKIHLIIHIASIRILTLNIGCKWFFKSIIYGSITIDNTWHLGLCRLICHGFRQMTVDIDQIIAA